MMEREEKKAGSQDDPYEEIKIDENKADDMIACDVCCEEEWDWNNEIVICELCLVGVH